MLAARITLPHFSVSSAISLPNWAGDPGSGVPPRSARRAFILGSSRAALTSLLSWSTISAGVAHGRRGRTNYSPRSPARTHLPSGCPAARPSASRWLLRAKQPASPDVLDGRRHCRKAYLYLPREEIGQSRPCATIENVHHINTSHYFEKLAGHMHRRTRGP